MRWVVLALGFATVLAGASWSGDYGLTVAHEIKDGCKFDASRTRNTCSSSEVVQDLRRHYLEGKQFKLSAVEVGFLHCRVWFETADERNAVYSELVALAAAPKAHFESSLLDSIGCFPFRSMRTALEEELAQGGHSSEAKLRLESAHAVILENYRE